VQWKASQENSLARASQKLGRQTPFRKCPNQLSLNFSKDKPGSTKGAEFCCLERIWHETARTLT
jgi:hypothetical protein